MKRFFIIALMMLSLMIIISDDAFCGASNFTLEDMDGNLFVLKDNLGKGPILLDFWATWCTPCKNALPYMQEIYDKYKDQGFSFVSISIDSPKSQGKIKPLIMSKKFTFPVLLDPNSEVLKMFQGVSVPFQVLFDKDGNIIETHTGYNPGDEKVIEEKIKSLLTPGSVNE